jgi:hypothetical protein
MIAQPPWSQGLGNGWSAKPITPEQRAHLAGRGQWWGERSRAKGANDYDARHWCDRYPRIGPLEQVHVGSADPAHAHENGYSVVRVRWPVLKGLWRGVLFRPAGEIRAAVSAVPDADQAPEIIRHAL